MIYNNLIIYWYFHALCIYLQISIMPQDSILPDFGNNIMYQFMYIIIIMLLNIKWTIYSINF